MAALSAAPGPRRSPVPWPVIATRIAAALVVGCLAAAVLRGTQTGIAEEPRDWVVSLACVLLGTRVVAHAPRNPVGWLLILIAWCAAAAVALAGFPASRGAAWLTTWTWIPAYTLLPAVALVFPTGRPSSRWGAGLALTSALGTAAMMLGLAAASRSSPLTFWDDAVGGRVDRSWATTTVGLGLALVATAAAGAVGSLAVRCRVPGPHRTALVLSTVCAALTYCALVLELLGVPAVWWLGALALPAAAVVAVTHYGLFDIDLLVHRSVLFGGSSIVLLALYSVVAFSAGQAVPDGAHAAAAVAVVLAVAPVHTWLRGRLDRWLHGYRSDPYRALSDLGHRLEASLAPEEVLPIVVQQVSTALKAPYVALRLSTAAGTVVDVGTRRGWPALVVPLSFRGATVAEMTVETRAADEVYDSRERRLLADLARSAAAAAHALALTEDLRTARERLVLAREEERKRLRRDLHDSVGGALSGIVMQLSAAGRRLDADPARTGQLIASATRDLDETIREVRRFVDDLRPAVLDGGLRSGIQVLANRFSGTDLQVGVHVAADLGPLPAAVEVAAFHIVGEALANAARHACAGRCEVRVTRAAAGLTLEVQDDGQGRGVARREGAAGLDPQGGVGLGSMSERASELGGDLHVDVAGRGTRVVAWLPLVDAPRPDVPSVAPVRATTDPGRAGR